MTFDIEFTVCREAILVREKKQVSAFHVLQKDGFLDLNLAVNGALTHMFYG